MTEDTSAQAVERQANDCRDAQAALKGGDTFPTGQDVLRRAADLLETLAAERDALQAAAQPHAVTVKPLVWVPTTIKGEHLRDTAQDMDGKLRYEVGVTEGHYYLMVSRPQGGLESRGSYGSEELAKAAAQADYERRILSAIDAQPASEVRKAAYLKAADAILSNLDSEKGYKINTGERPYICEETAYRNIRALADQEGE
jgi:hypothetical protein